ARDVLGDDVKILAVIRVPEAFPISDSLIIEPLTPEEATKVEVVKGPNIAYLPVPEAPEENLTAKISLKAGDNVSTDDITPASAEFSSMRSNIPLMSKYCFHRYDPDFAERAKNLGKSIIVGGENYGQGSSREHAAINPMFLGVKCVIAKNIARIHKGNLVNHGIVPMLFENPADYERLEQGDTLEIAGFPEQLKAGRVKVVDKDKGFEFWTKPDMTDSEVEISLDGGQLRHLRKQLEEMGIITKGE
ncbi:MAG: aconitate hydratase, partial [Synergistaceae bacterium]|nr:aconitate hydratase [Synergistaceae bacterium]